MWKHAFLSCLVTITGCDFGFKPPLPDIRDVEVALGAGMAIGQTSSIAMNSVSAPSPAACVTVNNACTSSYPCNGSVTVNLGAECPLPLGEAVAGTVTVSGTWSSADQATAQVTFVDATAGGQSVVVTSATSLSVKRSAGKVSVTYVGQNVSTKGQATLAAQSSWSIAVENAGTANDPRDDKLTLTGTQQQAGGSTTNQVTVTNAVMAPTCRANPVSGSATIQKVTNTSVQQSFLTFHSACDGMVDVGGQSVKLNVFE